MFSLRSARLSDAPRSIFWKLGRDDVGPGGSSLTWIESRSSFLGQLAKPFFRRTSGKWRLEKELDKMAITAGRYYTLLRPSRCPDHGVLRKRMRYNTFREQGLFVGSGVVEAGCKTVIGQRLKQSGMEWSVRGANAIIALRCIMKSNRLEDYWESRVA